MWINYSLRDKEYSTKSEVCRYIFPEQLYLSYCLKFKFKYLFPSTHFDIPFCYIASLLCHVLCLRSMFIIRREPVSERNFPVEIYKFLTWYQRKQSDQQKKVHRAVAKISLLYSASTTRSSLLLCHPPCHRLVSGKSTRRYRTVFASVVVLHRITDKSKLPPCYRSRFK